MTSPQSTEPKGVGPWSYEVHELSTGYSAIVYDERGQALADHLDEEVARLIAAAPCLLEALKAMVLNDTHTYRDCHKAAVAAIARATGGEA
jgi:hypothetical protein